ncbi:MAG: ATP-grasp domain-containing protein [Bacteroidota bacterium]
MSKVKLAILKNELEDDHLDWIKACDNYSDQVEYDVIDLVAQDWLEKATRKKYQFFLTKAPGRIAYYKQLYDERVYILNQVLGLPVYPTLNELLIYENKRFLSYYLKAKNIPHPDTWVFYNKQEAKAFSETCSLPIVAKTNIGAGGSGVKIFKKREELRKYIDTAFSEKGIKRGFMPNFRKGDYLKRLMKRISNPAKSIDYFKEKKKAATVEPQKFFVLFQEYIQSEFEWRCVVINNSYFGHKKLRFFGEKMSGTSKVSWDVPDEELLNTLKKIVDENGFQSQAIDLFYNKTRGYLVNELQCFWGSKNPHQMIMDGVPGRFVYQGGEWIFDEGSFNQNNSYDLRLQHVLELIRNK